MGGTISGIFSKRPGDCVLLLGLDGAGKTTILLKMKLGKVEEDQPKLGFVVKTVTYKRTLFRLWDVNRASAQQLRPLWLEYTKGATALIYVVDSNDRDRLDESAEELHKLLKQESLLAVPVLVFANKQDRPNAMSPADVAEKLALHSIANKWHMQGLCAGNGDGLFEGLDWLSALMERQ